MLDHWTIKTEAIVKFKCRPAVFPKVYTNIQSRLAEIYQFCCMELPSSRELELEILLRGRDAQLTELTVRSCCENGISIVC